MIKTNEAFRCGGRKLTKIFMTEMRGNCLVVDGIKHVDELIDALDSDEA